MKLTFVFVALLGIFAVSAMAGNSTPSHKTHKVKKHKGVKHRS